MQSFFSRMFFVHIGPIISGILFVVEINHLYIDIDHLTDSQLTYLMLCMSTLCGHNEVLNFLRLSLRGST